MNKSLAGFIFTSIMLLTGTFIFHDNLSDIRWFCVYMFYCFIPTMYGHHLQLKEDLKKIKDEKISNKNNE